MLSDSELNYAQNDNHYKQGSDSNPLDHLSQICADDFHLFKFCDITAEDIICSTSKIKASKYGALLGKFLKVAILKCI